MDDDGLSLGDWLARHDGSAGLVFTDVVGSTLLLFSRETLDYRRLLRTYRTHAVEVIGRLGGRLVDETGDELLTAFPDATRAYAFASEVFRDPGHPNLRIRAGVHFGAVRAEGEALVGRNVHLGARVMQRAVDRELWVSDAAKSAMEDERPDEASRISWLGSDECELKGIPGKYRLWRAA